MRSRTLACGIAVLLAITGCSSPSSENEAASLASPQVTDFGTVPTPPQQTTMPPPPRFAAELPDRSAALLAWRDDAALPPLPHVMERLQHGDPAMFARLRASAARVAADDSDAWAKAWNDLLRFRDLDEGFCRESRAELARDASPMHAALTPLVAEKCDAGAKASGSGRDSATEDVAQTRALIDRLVAAGFARASRVDPAQVGPYVENVLTEAGYGHWFDVETGMYPNEHDALMRDLAQLVSPALDAALFEEVPPTVDDGSAPYLLRVYLDGERHQIEAANLGDWYDVAQLLKLMNAVLEATGSDQRLLALSSEDQTATVVGAPIPLLHAAIESGLIVPGDPEAPREIGRAFEARVIGTKP